MSSYIFKGPSYQQNEYMLNKLWFDGTFAVFLLENEKYSFENNEKNFVVCPYASNWFNTYDFPSYVTLINNRGVSFIPTDRQFEVNSNVVLCFAQHSHESVKEVVDKYIKVLVDVEMTIRTCLILQKMPWALKSTPENVNRLRDIFQCLENDASAISLSAEDLTSIDVIQASAPFIIDKLYAYKVAIENELLTFLGVDNIGQEKKERLVKDEANANNEIINDYGDSILYNLKSFCKDAKSVLNVKISVEAKASPASALSEESANQKKEENKDVPVK